MTTTRIKINPFQLRTDDMPNSYLINGNATVVFWSDGKKTVSKFKKDSDILEKYDRELGFLYCCYQHYKRNWSRNKRLRILEMIFPSDVKNFLIEIFAEANMMEIKDVKKYLKKLISDNKRHDAKTHKIIRKGDKIDE